MGYTHYWYRKQLLDEKKFNEFAKACEAILTHCQNELGITLGDAMGEREPVVNPKIVAFNGTFDKGHESAMFKQELTQGQDYISENERGLCFEFCKTAYKPYDVAVTACLIAANHIFGEENFTISSDGGEEGFQEGRELCQQLLGYGLDSTEEEVVEEQDEQEGDEMTFFD